jgi:hypothetical protein
MGVERGARHSIEKALENNKKISSVIRQIIIHELEPYVKRGAIEIDPCTPFLLTIRINTQREDLLKCTTQKVCHFEFQTVKEEKSGKYSRDVWVTFESDGIAAKYTCFSLVAGLNLIKSWVNFVS